jgi:hypothetical protein
MEKLNLMKGRNGKEDFLFYYFIGPIDICC